MFLGILLRQCVSWSASSCDLMSNPRLTGLFPWPLLILPCQLAAVSKFHRPLTLRGIVKYGNDTEGLDADAAQELPKTQRKATPVVLPENGLSLQPVRALPAPAKPDVRHVMAWDFHVDASGRDNSGVTRGWTSFNKTEMLSDRDGLSFEPPTDTPMLFDLAHGVDLGKLPEERLPIVTRPGQVIDLVLLNREFREWGFVCQ